MFLVDSSGRKENFRLLLNFVKSFIKVNYNTAEKAYFFSFYFSNQFKELLRVNCEAINSNCDKKISG